MAVFFFAAATLASAWLMFSAEPLLAKMLLPLLGGAPAVWNASLVFFQSAVVAGYAAAHALSRIGTRAHAAVHAVLVAAAWLTLPFQLHAQLLATAHPSLRVLAMLAATAGIAFFVLAMNGPAVARVFAGLDMSSSRDPYLLYAASNAGSLVALIAYPLVVERHLGLTQQARAFGWGWLVLAVLVTACAAIAFRLPVRAHQENGEVAAPIAWSRRLRWLGLAAIPSAQLLGVTQFITTDVAPAPLLWVVPLAIYLLSFVLVFTERMRPKHAVMVRVLPLFAAMAALTLESEVNSPAWVVTGVHLGSFALAAMVCHGELANDRPTARRLTEFYLWMSAGGVVGGLAVALLAPVVLSRNVEYPLTIVLALIVRAKEKPSRSDLFKDVGYAVAIGLLTLATIRVAMHFGIMGRGLAFLLAVPVLVMYQSLARPLRFAFALGATFLASSTYEAGGHALLHTRNFFGALRVQIDTSGRFTQLVHGTTVHGRQTIDPAHRREATSYYHATGPIGDVLQARAQDTRSIGVIGLGAGSLAAYARPEERWTFFEINPAVVAIATNPRWFTFLSDAFPQHGQERIIVGDARLELARIDERFDLLVVDAFSSDAIPMHLLTLEALDVYLAHLAARGKLVFHCSNRHLDLEPVLAALAAERVLDAKIRIDEDVTPEQEALGKNPSTWVAMAREPIELPSAWRTVRARANVSAWTDDASSIVPILF